MENTKKIENCYLSVNEFTFYNVNEIKFIPKILEKKEKKMKYGSKVIDWHSVMSHNCC